MPGIALVQQRRPGLVLLDLQLPGMPGDEVLRQLRAEPSTRAIPVVILTADAMPELAVRLLSAGATRCLTKPFDIPTLLQTIDQLLASSTESNHA